MTNTANLENVAAAMVSPGKGILAIDESHATIGKRFAAVGVDNEEQNRREYRDLLISAPGIDNFISGMILFDETMRQRTTEGTVFPDILAEHGMLSGIKVDKGAKDLAGHPGEKITEGLDGLRDRLNEYSTMGARFAKWRAVITIGDGIPGRACIEGNSHALARYAALCQEAGLVPMVEPEVLMDGNHSIDKCEAVTNDTLRSLFNELYCQGVILEALVLKTSMVISGNKCEEQAKSTEVAERTVRCLKNQVPASTAGVVFLSGGQSPQQATENLNNINKCGDCPWPLSFSYGRALQQPCLDIWGKDQGMVQQAQGALKQRCELNSKACRGEYSTSMEK